MSTPGNSHVFFKRVNQKEKPNSATTILRVCARITANLTILIGENDSADNNFLDGWVTLTIPSDISGNHVVDIFDIVKMAGVYGVQLPDSHYDPNCDIEGDGDIDIFDIVIAADNYGKSW